MSYKSIFEQTAEWEQERLGKFTASEIHRLMGKGRKKEDYFGQDAQTYIKQKLAEIITQTSCVKLDGLPAIEHGNSYELEAVTAFENRTLLKCEYFGKANPKFYPFEPLADYAGGSPDGFAAGDAVIEVKCPFNPAHHITHLLIPDAETLKAEKPEYYGQLQFNMLCSKKNQGFFISYDPRPVFGHLKLHIVEVPLDQEYCDELTERLHEAVKQLSVLMDCINQKEEAI